MTAWFIHCVISVMLMCLIWVIQLVHYPFFKFVDITKSKKAFEFHQKSISYIVMPLMIAELASATYLLVNFYSPFYKLLISNLAIILLIWIQTFVVMVPLHMKLITNFNEATVKRLVNQNWFRTIIWTIKALLWVVLIYHGLTASLVMST